jgi:hypothetical protein
LDSSQWQTVYQQPGQSLTGKAHSSAGFRSNLLQINRGPAGTRVAKVSISTPANRANANQRPDMKLASNLRITTAIALSALALSLAALTSASTPKSHAERGTIKSVDVTDHTLVVTDQKGNAEHKYQWNDQTKFTEHGKVVTPTDLKVGEQVHISYKRGGDMPTLEHVFIAPAKADKQSANPAPSSARSQNTLPY